MQDVENLFLEVGRAIDDQDFSEAKSLLEDILMIDPGYGRAHNHLGWIYETKMKDFEKAKRHYELAIKFCKGEYPVVYVNFAYLLIDFDQYDTAEKIIAEGLKINGSDRSTLTYQKGKIAENKKKFRTALMFYKEARRLAFNKEFFNMLDAETKRVREKMNFFERIIY